MKMKFYDALQMDPAILKRKIAACDTKQDKLYYWTAMAVRSVLIVVFAIVFISLLSGVFGSDNTPMAVALFCIMLGIRFVNFEYCIGDSLLTLAATLAILVLAPSAAAVLPPVFLIPLHCQLLFDPFYDDPAAGDGKWRAIQLRLYLPYGKSGRRGGPHPPRAFGSGGVSSLCGNPGGQAPASA